MRTAFIGAAVALVWSGIAHAQTVNVNPGTFHNCGVTGDAKQQQAIALDKFKNRATVPTAGNIHPDITAAWIMQPSTNDTGRFNDTDAATIRIFVTDVKMGGVETANCHAKQKQWRDTHIEGNATGAGYSGQPMIVEVTPRWRAAMQAAGVDWSTDTLHSTLIGHWVEITGWMLEDSEHRPNSANASGTSNIWRQTTWEIHPITAMKIVGGPE